MGFSRTYCVGPCFENVSVSSSPLILNTSTDTFYRVLPTPTETDSDSNPMSLSTIGTRTGS